MKRKVIALVTTLLVSGSVGAYAASGNLSTGTLQTAAALPQNAVTKTATVPASSSCSKSAAISSAVQEALSRAKASGSCPQASSAAASVSAETGKSVRNGTASSAQSKNCPNSGTAVKSGSSTGAVSSQGTPAASKAYRYYYAGKNRPTSSNTQSVSYNDWVNSVLKSLCGKSSSGTSGGTSSKTVSSKPVSTPSSSQTSGSGYSAFQNEVVSLVNSERAKNGLAALSVDSAITKTATLKSQDMAKNHYFSHTSPTYGSPFDLMKQYGVSYRTAGENIAMGQTSPAQVMNGWMNSPGHRANILNASYTKIGVGVARNSSGTYYWTQHFIG